MIQNRLGESLIEVFHPLHPLRLGTQGIDMHPLKEHLNKIRETSTNGEYGETLDTLTKQLGISKPTLYRLYHKGRKRRTLSPANAIKLELLTKGNVPAESVNDEIGLIFAMIAQLVQAEIRSISVITK